MSGTLFWFKFFTGLYLQQIFIIDRKFVIAKSRLQMIHIFKNKLTVIILISLRYRYRFWDLLNTVTSTLPHRYLTVTLPLLTITDRYGPLLTVTVTHRFFGNLIFFSLQF